MKCSVEDCDKAAKYVKTGWCSSHWWRMRHHGSLSPELNQGGKGKAKKKVVKYRGAHTRVRAKRGLASEHQCVSCGLTAQTWAYDHTDPNELIGETRGRSAPYSLDPDFYHPMCVKCHNNFDNDYDRKTNAGKRS